MAATAVARTRTFRLNCMAANLLDEGWERSHGDSAVPGRVSRSPRGRARPHVAELRRDRLRRPGAAEIFHALQGSTGPGASPGWVRAVAMPAPMQAVQKVRGKRRGVPCLRHRCPFRAGADPVTAITAMGRVTARARSRVVDREAKQPTRIPTLPIPMINR